MNRNGNSHDERKLVREALRRAAQDPEPDMGRLLGAVPEILAEVRRRRLQDRETPLTMVIPLAWKAIPRLAVAAAILVLVCTTLLFRDTVRMDRGRQDLDTVLLVGTDAAGIEDLLLGDVNIQDNGNG